MDFITPLPKTARGNSLLFVVVDEVEVVLLELLPGDVAVFDGFTPHRSDPNRSDRWRKQLYSWRRRVHSSE